MRLGTAASSLPRPDRALSKDRSGDRLLVVLAVVVSLSSKLPKKRSVAVSEEAVGVVDGIQSYGRK